MKASTKGILLSGLVYPGSGQLALGSKLSGTLFAVLTTGGLLLILYRLTMRLYHAADPMLLSLADHTLNWQTFVEIFNRAPYDNWRAEIFSLGVVTTCWVAAAVHAYFVGHKIDREAAPSTHA